MNLAQKLANPPARTGNGPKCSVGSALRSLDETSRAALEVALDLRASSGEYAWPEQALKSEVSSDGGPFIGEGAIGKHRRRQCGCFRESR
jgi:hypothetical protein